MPVQHILFSEMFTDKADALLERNLDRELENKQIGHSEYQCLTAEQDLVRQYRRRYQSKKGMQTA